MIIEGVDLSTEFDKVQWRNWKNTKTSVTYAFQRHGDILFIYLQDSSGKGDWKRNFSLTKRPYKDMEIPYRVHGGFLKSWKEIRRQCGENRKRQA